MSQWVHLRLFQNHTWPHDFPDRYIGGAEKIIYKYTLECQIKCWRALTAAKHIFDEATAPLVLVSLHICTESWFSQTCSIYEGPGFLCCLTLTEVVINASHNNLIQLIILHYVGTLKHALVCSLLEHENLPIQRYIRGSTLMTKYAKCVALYDIIHKICWQY